jgi:glycine/D-amino acid oxidase-like deaminating enzyme
VKAAAGRGLDLREGVEVERIAGGGNTVETSTGPMSADLVFVAAGAWTRPLVRRSGLDLPVFHSHAEFLYTAPTEAIARYQTSWGSIAREQGERESIAGPRIDAWRDERDEELLPPSVEHALVQYPDGHLRIGQVTRFIPALRHEPNPETRDLLIESVRRLLPAAERLPGLRLGSRPVSFTPDHLPIVARLPGLPQTLLVATSTSPTILAPALGEALATYAVGGAWDSALDEWSLDREAVHHFAALPRTG